MFTDAINNEIETLKIKLKIYSELQHNMANVQKIQGDYIFELTRKMDKMESMLNKLINKEV